METGFHLLAQVYHPGQYPEQRKNEKDLQLKHLVSATFAHGQSQVAHC